MKYKARAGCVWAACSPNPDQSVRPCDARYSLRNTVRQFHPASVAARTLRDEGHSQSVLDSVQAGRLEELPPEGRICFRATGATPVLAVCERCRRRVFAAADAATQVENAAQEHVPEDEPLGAAGQACEDADEDGYARRLGAQRGASGAIALQCARGGWDVRQDSVTEEMLKLVVLHLFEALHGSTDAGVRGQAMRGIAKVQLMNRSACELVRDAKEGEVHGDSLRAQSTASGQAKTIKKLKRSGKAMARVNGALRQRGVAERAETRVISGRLLEAAAVRKAVEAQLAASETKLRAAQRSEARAFHLRETVRRQVAVVAAMTDELKEAKLLLQAGDDSATGVVKSLEGVLLDLWDTSRGGKRWLGERYRDMVVVLAAKFNLPLDNCIPVAVEILEISGAQVVGAPRDSAEVTKAALAETAERVRLQMAYDFTRYYLPKHVIPLTPPPHGADIPYRARPERNPKPEFVFTEDSFPFEEMLLWLVDGAVNGELCGSIANVTGPGTEAAAEPAQAPAAADAAADSPEPELAPAAEEEEDVAKPVTLRAAVSDIMREAGMCGEGGPTATEALEFANDSANAVVMKTLTAGCYGIAVGADGTSTFYDRHTMAVSIGGRWAGHCVMLAAGLRRMLTGKSAAHELASVVQVLRDMHNDQRSIGVSATDAVNPYDVIVRPAPLAAASPSRAVPG